MALIAFNHMLLTFVCNVNHGLAHPARHHRYASMRQLLIWRRYFARTYLGDGCLLIRSFLIQGFTYASATAAGEKSRKKQFISVEPIRKNKGRFNQKPLIVKCRRAKAYQNQSVNHSEITSKHHKHSDAFVLLDERLIVCVGGTDASHCVIKGGVLVGSANGFLKWRRSLQDYLDVCVCVFVPRHFL